MSKLDTAKLHSKKSKIRLGGKTITIGDNSTVRSTPGGTASQVLSALKSLGKIKIDLDQYGLTD